MEVEGLSEAMGHHARKRRVAKAETQVTKEFELLGGAGGDGEEDQQVEMALEIFNARNDADEERRLAAASHTDGSRSTSSHGPHR